MDRIAYTPYRAFGWVVLKAECLDGYTFSAKVTRAGARAESANFTLHTSGVLNARCLTDDLPMIAQRVPGMSSLDLNALRAGEFEFVAQGDVRWWCINWIRNGNKLPNIEPVVIAQNASRSFPVGSRLFVCEGSAYVNGSSVSGPVSLSASTQPLGVVATAPLYGMLFV